MTPEQLGCLRQFGKCGVAGAVCGLISKSMGVGSAQQALLQRDTEEALQMPLHGSGLCDPPLAERLGSPTLQSVNHLCVAPCAVSVMPNVGRALSSSVT